MPKRHENKNRYSIFNTELEENILKLRNQSINQSIYLTRTCTKYREIDTMDTDRVKDLQWPFHLIADSVK